MNILEISAEYLDKINLHGINTYPGECCGFFFGTEDGNRVITEIVPVPNSRKGNQARRFEIAPDDYIQAENHAMNNNLLLLGIYHSHPDHPAKPSEYDRTHAFPFFSYIITSINNREINEVTCWRLNDQNQFEQELLKITVN